MEKKFLRFRYAAIKRYGEKTWTAASGYIEFNPTYTVSCGADESGLFGDEYDEPYIIELSNGTKFLTFISNDHYTENVLSEEGVNSNRYSTDQAYAYVGEHIEEFNLRSKRYGSYR